MAKKTMTEEVPQEQPVMADPMLDGQLTIQGVPVSEIINPAIAHLIPSGLLEQISDQAMERAAANGPRVQVLSRGDGFEKLLAMREDSPAPELMPNPIMEIDRRFQLAERGYAMKTFNPDSTRSADEIRAQGYEPLTDERGRLVRVGRDPVGVTTEKRAAMRREQFKQNIPDVVAETKEGFARSVGNLQSEAISALKDGDRFRSSRTGATITIGQTAPLRA